MHFRIIHEILNESEITIDISKTKLCPDLIQVNTGKIKFYINGLRLITYSSLVEATSLSS